MTTPDTTETPQSGEIGSWYQLILYTTTVLAVGLLAGHFITLCPTNGLRVANYSWSMYISYGLLIVFGFVMFISIGFRLKPARPSGKDGN